ncbi:hypothetical protein [Spirosoma jeollabukense]
MHNPPVRTSFSRLSTLTLVIVTLLGACSKPEPADPVATAPAKYELKDIRYFLSQNDRVDTTTLQLKGLSVQNTSAVLSTQQVEEGFSELVKRSRFIIDPTMQLPKEVDLSKFEVNVPEHWYGNGLFGRSIDTYSFSAIEQQKPYGFNSNGLLTVKIPPKSKLDISRQITAYQLACSFDATLENTTTGQRYSLRGKWEGLLQYDNPSTTLKQSAL